SPAALLESPLHTGHGVVPLPATYPAGPYLDREGRCGDASDVARHSGAPPYHRLGALVALCPGSSVAAERRSLLCSAVRDEPVATPGSHHMGRVSERALDRDPVCLARLSGGS